MVKLLNRKKSATSDQVVDPEIGKFYKNKGIYQGTWEPTDEKGRPLGKIFDWYAARTDIKDNSKNILMTPNMSFNRAVQRIAKLKNWDGHDGIKIKNHKNLLKIIRKNPEKLSNWFVPPLDLLKGEDVNGNKVLKTNLFDNRNKMPQDSRFVTQASNRPQIIDAAFTHIYHSCTERKDGILSSKTCDVDFSSGNTNCHYKNDFRSSTRPVRAELRR